MFTRLPRSAFYACAWSCVVGSTHVLPVVVADAAEVGLLRAHEVQHVQVLVPPPAQALRQLLLGLQRAHGCGGQGGRVRCRGLRTATGQRCSRRAPSPAARAAANSLMNPALSRSLWLTAALMMDSAKSSTTSTLLPFLSGDWPATALISVAMMSAGEGRRRRWRRRRLRDRPELVSRYTADCGARLIAQSSKSKGRRVVGRRLQRRVHNGSATGRRDRPEGSRYQKRPRS